MGGSEVGDGDVPRFCLVTSNPDKLVESERVLGEKLENVDLDLPEIQSGDLKEVLEAKAEQAWSTLERPVIVEETGFELDALGGFPGPLVKWMLAAVGAEGIARVAIALDDPRATARCLVALRDGKTVQVGEGSCSGHLVLPARGGPAFGWDPVFVPDGYDATVAELGPEVKDEIGHRGRAWRDLLRKLDQPMSAESRAERN